MVKIPISKDNSEKKAIKNPIGGVLSDIKKPVELKNIKFGSKNNFNFKKFLFIVIPILGIVLILASLANWYRDYQENKQVELKTQIEEEKIIPNILEEVIEEEAEEKPKMILIQETETGWLNVREGAGTSFEIILKIYPGESYILLEEVEEWFKIELGDNQEGWIFSQYAIKQGL